MEEIILVTLYHNLILYSVKAAPTSRTWRPPALVPKLQDAHTLEWFIRSSRHDTPDGVTPETQSLFTSFEAFFGPFFKCGAEQTPF